MMTLRQILALAGCAALVATALPAAHAQKRDHSAYAVCEDGLQDRAACRQEVGAVRQRAPEDPAGDFGQNALRRCNVHKDPEARQACEERVRHQHVHSQGSVMGGGMFHEHRFGPGAQQ